MTSVNAAQPHPAPTDSPVTRRDDRPAAKSRPKYGRSRATRVPNPPALEARQQLTNMRALLVLSILMTESPGEDQILHLAASSAPSLGPCRAEGFAFTGTEVPDDERWRPGSDPSRRCALPDHLGQALAQLPAAGGSVPPAPGGWSWAYPLRTVAGQLGFLVVSSPATPDSNSQFLVQVVAQQAGVAIYNARLHQRERAGVEALAKANQALEGTVATLRRGMEIHERLTAVAAAGEGFDGIAQALHELTSLPVVIEDRYGNLRAWAGPEAERHHKPDPARLGDLLRQLVAEGRCLRFGSRLVALASPRPDVRGFISLIDPERRSDASDLVALEHCATVLAVELARLRGLADTELRLRRELLQDLLTGIEDQSALARAEALGYDLGPAHRVLLVEMSGQSRPQEDCLHAVRRALRELRVVALLGSQGSGVVVVVVVVPDGAIPGGDWDSLRRATMAELGGVRCRLGVGNPYPRPSELPRSLREAQLTLRLQAARGMPEHTMLHSDLGVYQMFAALPQLSEVDDFARRWLGPLIEYDTAKRTDLVKTLTHYLNHGGRYGPTSESLAVHRSTLKYRLHRIRELTGFDLSDPETHFNLELATRAWTTRQAMQD